MPFGSSVSTRASRATGKESARLGFFALAAVLGAAVAGALASGCAPQGAPKAEAPAEDSPPEGGGIVSHADELFRPAEGDPGLLVFSLSDPAYITSRGYTLWTLRAPAQRPFAGRRAVLNKAKGSPEAGYGLVFCHREEDERMLVVMIDVQGEYIVGEARGAAFASIVPWTSSPLLKRGYNQDNEIGLRLDAGTGTFFLSINGVETQSFSAEEPDYELGGGNGYIVVVSPLDRFPAAPVVASFREE